MSNICRICGCTDEQPCITEEGPCSWAMKDLCTACIIDLGPGENCFKGSVSLIVPKECRNCALVVEGLPWRGKPNFTCDKGRFDGPDLSPPAHQWYAWRGISRPNKGVAKAQKGCPFFDVHPRLKNK